MKTSYLCIFLLVLLASQSVKTQANSLENNGSLHFAQKDDWLSLDSNKTKRFTTPGVLFMTPN
jgi:hypothetical protein